MASLYPTRKALILTGSAARGEATVVREGDQVRWLSDLEALVVVRDDSDLRRAAAALDYLASQASTRLRDLGTIVDIELTPAPERYFSTIQPHLFGYELLSHGRVLDGPDEYLSRIPRFHAEQIPKEDAWRLLSNRMVEWLQRRRQVRSLYEQFYAVIKQYLDLNTSLSIFSGSYQPSYLGRAASAGETAGKTGLSLLDRPGREFGRATRIAAEFKLYPESEQFRWLRASRASDLESALEAAGWKWLLEDLAGLLNAVWVWELSQLGGTTVKSRKDALRVLQRIYGVQGRLRGWGKLVLRSELRKGAKLLPRLMRLFTKGTPRALVYLCAAELLAAQQNGSREPLSWVKAHLPLIYGSCADNWDDLAGQCVSNWETFLRRSSA